MARMLGNLLEKHGPNSSILLEYLGDRRYDGGGGGGGGGGGIRFTGIHIYIYTHV
jgi:hypothetical protein